MHPFMRSGNDISLYIINKICYNQLRKRGVAQLGEPVHPCREFDLFVSKKVATQ